MWKKFFHIVILFLFISCTPESDKAISKVKTGKIIGFGGEYIPVQQLIDGIARADGDVKWSYFVSERDNKELKVVQANIGRKNKKAMLQFIYNSDRDIYDLTYFEVNGKSPSLFELIKIASFGL